MIIVEATRTPMTEDEAVSGLVDAWPDVDREQAALFLALIWTETGSGRSCVRHNVGNLSASDTFPGMAWRPPWFEIDEESSERMKRLHQMMLDGRAPKAFRAYRTLVEGFADFVRLLHTSPYAPLRAAASTGDVPTFRAELARRYSADYTPAHDRGFAQLQAKFRPLVEGQPAPSTSNAPGLVASGGGGVILLLALARAFA